MSAAARLFSCNMQTHLTCECGNKVKVPNELADADVRCPRCGRRLVNDEAAECKQPEEAGLETGAYEWNVAPGVQTQRPGTSDDPEATAIHSTVSKKESVVGSGAATLPADDFVVNNTPAGEDSSIALHSQSPGHSSHGAKYDLTQRVMRPIAKPVLPVIPYNGTGEYGIHRILRVHQRGGMGRILVAYDQYLKREVAIKELHPDVAEDESIVRRFIGEAEITAQLEHPGVVPIHRLGQGRDGLPYYTMKMIKGETLQDAIKAYHRKPSRPELLNLVRRLVSVSKTIAFAHSKGVIHRDLKPANVMLGEHSETLVMDWGLAKPYSQTPEDSYISIIHRTKQSRPELTMVGAIVGTPAFMSPEQAQAEESMVSPLSDVFSLGTVLYYLLAGQTAFSGRSTQEVLNKVRACNPIPPSQIKANVPRGLEAICLKAMEKSPENRYQGASEFADDLCRWLDDEPVIAEKPTFWTKFRWWITHHRTISVAVPCVIFLSVLFSTLSVWFIEQHPDSHAGNGNVPALSTEFQKPLQINGSQGVDVWTKHQSLGELSITCQVKPTTSEQLNVISLYAPANEMWNLSDRRFLTFSLLEASLGEGAVLQNFRIRLGQGEAYHEYRPSKNFWENRNSAGWTPFKIPLQETGSDWQHDVIGKPVMEKIEWIRIHFETNAGMILNIDNFKFQNE